MRLIMSEVSLRKVGSSFVTTIPARVVSELHLKAGQRFQISKENGHIVLTPVNADLKAVMQAHEKVINKYRAAFQKLADA